MSHSHDAHTNVLRGGGEIAGKYGAPKTISHILSHTLSVAAWAVAPRDPSLRQIGFVDMVVPDGGRDH